MRKWITLVAAVGILSAGLVLAQERPPAPKRAPQAPAAKMKADLGITPEQEAKIKAHREARRAESKAFAGEMRKFRDDMQALRNDPKSDPKKMEALIDRMFKLRADRAKAGIQAGRELRAIFTPEQLEKMKMARGRFLRSGPMMGFGQGSRPGMRMRPGQMMRGPRMGFGRFRPGVPGAGHFGRTMMRPWMNRMGGHGWGWHWRWDKE
ncbi:MAG: periplasmic heavy metal sensor [Candidatus Aminicenantes bacterium]|nr:periplasmic heavy metal sensor [Candidatus Aminicenantes bacterium]